MSKEANKFQSKEEIKNIASKIFPNAMVETDDYGEIVIYTGLTKTKKGKLRKMRATDFN